MTVNHWIAAVITLILLGGTACFVAGYVYHENSRRSHIEERRIAHAMPSIGYPEPPMGVIAERIPTSGAPTVVNVYFVTPAQLSQLQGRPLVMDGEIVSELPPSDRHG